MLGIYFRTIEDDLKDYTWDITTTNIVTYVLIISFPVPSLS